jgi:D-glycero-alpha-D-manno-heptose-7-phosphate kinase
VLDDVVVVVGGGVVVELVVVVVVVGVVVELVVVVGVLDDVVVVVVGVVVDVVVVVGVLDDVVVVVLDDVVVVVLDDVVVVVGVVEVVVPPLPCRLLVVASCRIRSRWRCLRWWRRRRRWQRLWWRRHLCDTVRLGCAALWAWGAWPAARLAVTNPRGPATANAAAAASITNRGERVMAFPIDAPKQMADWPARSVDGCTRRPVDGCTSCTVRAVIVSRTPLRISFLGGGSDLPDFYERHGGAVVSTTVDKWIHVIVAPRFEGDVRVSYSKTEIVDSAADVEHDLVREAMRLAGVPRGIEVITLADVPSHGTGLGSSSTVTVGLLNALYAFQGIYKPPLVLAEEAAEIEIELLSKPIGRQDQYAAAVGGFNFIEFLPRGGGVRVEPIVCPPETFRRLQRCLLLFYTGRQRSADDVLHEQRRALQAGRSVHTLAQMADMARELRERLGAGEVESVGRMLHAAWELKRGLTGGVSDETIDGWYERALEAGAAGGKILGAGAGGFLMLFVPPERQASVRAGLASLREVPIKFSAQGTHIIMWDGIQR